MALFCAQVWIEDEGDDDDGHFEWDEKAGPTPVFESGHSTGAVTSRTSFGNFSYFGKEERPFVIVDTPGHDDPEGANIDEQQARDKLKEQAADLHAKLKNMSSLNLVLVVHNDVHSNRLNPATYELLKKVISFFRLK